MKILNLFQETLVIVPALRKPRRLESKVQHRGVFTVATELPQAVNAET